ncbi:LysE family translocator [Pseudomonas thivervalensis]|uniref:Lysine transporter LysE n=1 Tax=Pseudomonas thivervalensis TaxID=86265 RepID=A0A2Z4ZF36_9PSED|nr:LysE family translocator [Pseudomonas thivervalensis]AXA56717.1 lysine transporter LysE [Pseudomonas thivervalensis]AXA62530.1 lysine transporter LysE [Pseudomonas thivervalensis]
MNLDFLLTSLIVVASPGTGVVYTVAAGLAQGWRASVVAAFGCTLGVVPHMLAATTGLAALLHASMLAFEVIKYLGVAYLLWMAWSTLQSRGALDIDPNKTPRSNGAVIVAGILLNLLNPKLSIFFLAFLPQFLAPGETNAMGRMLQLSFVFMAITFAIFTLYGVFCASMRHHVLERPPVLRWMRRLFSAAFVLLAARLALMQ